MGSAFSSWALAALEDEAADELEAELALDDSDEPEQPTIPIIPQARAPATPTVAIFLIADDFSMLVLSWAATSSLRFCDFARPSLGVALAFS